MRLPGVSAVGAVVLFVGTLSIASVPQSAAAGRVRPVKPAVSSFAVTPSTLSDAGGSVTMSAQVTNATSCLFTANKPGITGLPALVPCSNGTVTEVVSALANNGKKTAKYRLHLSVTGVKTVHAKSVSLVVTTEPPPPVNAPTNVQATPAFRALDVTWTPEPPTPTIDGYTATATGPNLIVPLTCTGATTCYVSGLTNGVTYSVTVQAYYGVPPRVSPVGNPSQAAMGTPSASPNCSYVGEYARLHGCDLGNADLIGVNLTGSDLSDANLTSANLTDVSLVQTGFQGATMTDAILTDAMADFSDFSDANLSGADLSGADLSNGNLSGANLSNANLTGAGMYSNVVTGTILSGADLNSAAVEGEDFTGDDLSNANLTSALFLDDNFTDANLTGANFTDARVDSDDLTGATLTGATLTGATWNGTTCPDGTNSNVYSPQTCANDLG